MIIFLSVLAMSVIGFVIHLCLDKQPRTASRIVELLLLYQLIFSVGVASLLAFFGLSFLSQMVAQYVGTVPTIFEQELGNVNLGFAVLGIMCIWFRGEFWLATTLGFSIWIFADGLGHIVDMIQYDNYAPGNIGIPLFTDLLIPLILVTLLSLRYYLKKQTVNSAVQPHQPELIR